MRLLLFLQLIFLGGSIHAQVPQLINYQGVARDAAGNPFSNRTIKIQISILNGPDHQEPVYAETHQITTNSFGLYNLKIGAGLIDKGTFNQIHWETGNKFIKVRMDLDGRGEYEDAGITQLLSVPYALYALKADSAREVIHDSIRKTRASNNYIEKTNASGLVNSNSLLYDNGTNIGLNTNNPLARFHIYGTLAGSTELRLQHRLANGSARLSFFADTGSAFNTTNDYALMNKYTASTLGTLTAGFPIRSLCAFSNSKGSLFFSTAANFGIGRWNAATNTYSTRLFIDSASGFIGINTTTPVSRLDVNGQVRITGGNPGIGKILTSDANGLASWQNPIPGPAGPMGPQGPVGATGPQGPPGPAGGGVALIQTGTGLTGGPILSSGTISMTNTGVAPGTYGSLNATPILSINPQGQITAASTIPIDAVTSINTGIGLTGGPITNSGTIELANTGVLPGSYGSATDIPVLDINAQGQIIHASTTAFTETDPKVASSISDTYPFYSSITNSLIDGSLVQMSPYVAANSGFVAYDYAPNVAALVGVGGLYVEGDPTYASVIYDGLIVDEGINSSYVALGVIGTLHATSVSSAIKAFAIDHPLDPANKYLRHSSVESPDMMNMYNGNVTTDSIGTAIVHLPEYFEALNQDFRYQLTVLDDTQFAMARISQKIQNNVFKIQTDKPGIEVSWQITGIRHDASANHRRIKVEEEKPAEFKGKYIDPEAFGLDRRTDAILHQKVVNKPQN